MRRKTDHEKVNWNLMEVDVLWDLEIQESKKFGSIRTRLKTQHCSAVGRSPDWRQCNLSDGRGRTVANDSVSGFR
jgi:hypothetical protein